MSFLLMIIVAAAFAALAWRRLGLAVALLPALSPLYLWRGVLPVPGLRLPTTALELCLLAVAAVWLWQRGRHADAWAPLRPWLGPLALFLGAAVISTFVSPDWRAALGLLRAYFLEPALFFAMLADTLARDEHRRWSAWLRREAKAADILLSSLAALVIALGAVAVFQKLTGFGIPNPTWQAEATRRITTIYGFPNANGLLVAPLVVLFAAQAIALWDAGRRRAAALPVAAAFAGLVTAAFAVSQGALLGMGCGLFLLGLSDRRLRLPTLALAAVGLTAVLAVPAARTEAVALVTLSDDSGSVRQGIWSETAALLLDRPVFGAGLSGFQAAFAPYHEIRGVEIFMYPHSWPLNFWVETGLASLIAFAWIAARFFRRTGFRRAAAFAMVALLVHGLVDVPYFKNDLALLFWTIVALGGV